MKTFLYGLFTGISLSAITIFMAFSPLKTGGGDMQVTLYYFEIKKGKEQKFREWMAWQHKNHPLILSTLGREEMYFESIFKDTIAGSPAIYWLTVNGQGGKAVDDSPLEMDKTHNRYFKDVIKTGSRKVMKTEIFHIPGGLRHYIDTAGDRMFTP